MIYTIELCLSNEVAHCYLCRKNGCWVWMWCWRPWKARHSYILVSMARANGIRRFQRRHFAGRLLSYSCSYRKHLLYIHGFKRKHHLWGKSRWYKVLGPLFESCIVWQTPAVSKTLSEDKNEWPSRQVHLVSSWSLGHLLRPVLQRKLEIYGDFTCLPELSHRISITSGMLPLQVFTHQVDFFHPLKAVPTPSLQVRLSTATSWLLRKLNVQWSWDRQHVPHRTDWHSVGAGIWYIEGPCHRGSIRRIGGLTLLVRILRMAEKSQERHPPQPGHDKQTLGL